MKKEDVKIYREIQKNAERSIAQIDTVSEKIYDDALALQIAREALKYAEIRNRAVDKLLQGKVEPYKAKPFTEFFLKSGIYLNTVLNISTGHIAGLMIQKSNSGIMDMCRILNCCKEYRSEAVELAKEFMDFEERNIERLKKYL